jgi:hypothetical protein
MDQDLTPPDSDQSLCQEPPIAGTPSKELEDSQSQQARQQCVQNYLQHSLGQKDPMRAGFGVINADLMAVNLPLADLLKRRLSNPSLSIDDVQKMLPALETYHHLTRMIERFGQMDARIAAERRNRKRSHLAAEKPR